MYHIHAYKTNHIHSKTKMQLCPHRAQSNRRAPDKQTWYSNCYIVGTVCKMKLVPLTIKSPLTANSYMHSFTVSLIICVLELMLTHTHRWNILSLPCVCMCVVCVVCVWCVCVCVCVCVCGEVWLCVCKFHHCKYLIYIWWCPKFIIFTVTEQS